MKVPHDVKVTIVNRTIEHAKALALETMSSYDGLDRIGFYSGTVDLVVQTTSVGMDPQMNEDAAKGYVFSGKEIAFDLVYKPRETVFLRRAKEAGCRTISGASMPTMVFPEPQGRTMTPKPLPPCPSPSRAEVASSW